MYAGRIYIREREHVQKCANVFMRKITQNTLYVSAIALQWDFLHKLVLVPAYIVSGEERLHTSRYATNARLNMAASENFHVTTQCMRFLNTQKVGSIFAVRTEHH